MKDLEVTFLRDTAYFNAPNQPAETAAMLAQFVTGAKSSLDVAIYDFKLSGALASTVASAFKSAAGKGVKIRIGYDADKPAEQATSEQTIAAFEEAGGDPAPIGTEVWLEENLADVAGLEFKRIVAPENSLMHSKYIVRDVGSEQAGLWMGSANFTDGAWTRQENNVIRFTSSPLATAYERDFEDMWQAGAIAHTGKGDVGETAVDGIEVAWLFSPGEGKTIDKHLASVAAGATSKLRISSMVITSQALLNALTAAIDRGVKLDGVYDGGEMKGVEKEWEKWIAKGSAKSKAKLEAFHKVAKLLTEKPSAPYSDTGPHDFMHNKTLVADEKLVVTGSYNFSENAEGNAENQLTISDATIAKSYADYVKTLIDKYS